MLRNPEDVLTATKDLILPTTVTGSWPRPAWYTENLAGRPFSEGMADLRYREQFQDALAGLFLHLLGDVVEELLDVGGPSLLDEQQVLPDDAFDGHGTHTGSFGSVAAPK